MAGIVAPIDDEGNIVTRTDSGDSLTKKGKNNNIVDSDTFLTLLVAEMQNQDPLEPTSNTEWVSQYATFTQVQQLSEMGNAMDQLRANSMVGKEVVMKVTNASTGEVSYKDGVVEYVLVENGKTMLVIDGDKYSIDDLDSVLSDEYSEALGLYREWTAKFNALPSLQFVNEQYEGALKELFDDYYAMNDYQKSFMQKYAGDYLSQFQEYLEKLKLYGIEFEEPGEETKDTTTLDDILDSFNKRMDEILERLVSLSEASGSSGGSSSGASGGSSGADGTEAAGGSTAGNTAETEDAAGADGAGDDTVDTEDIENSETAGNTGSTDETDSSEETEGTDTDKADETGSTDSTEETSGSGGTEESGDDSEASGDGEAEGSEGDDIV